MSETIRDKAVIIKQEAKAIEDTVNDFKGLESMYVIEKCMKQINKTSQEGIEQIRQLQATWSDSKGKKGRRK